MSSRARRHTVTVSLFPFLAVLICIMGALVILLVLMVARVGAGVKPAAMAQDGLPSSEDKDALKQRAEDASWRAETLAQSRDARAQELAQQRGELAHLEDHIARLEGQAKELLERAQRIDEGKRLKDQDLATAREEISRLQTEAAQKKSELAKQQQAAANQEKWYALIPYDGPHGTRRRPIYIECTETGITIQPDSVTLFADDFRGPLGPGNPLDAALRTIRERMARDGNQAGEPYPLLIVRPSGIVAYGAARAALASWDDEFGYELISEDKKLDFGQPDPGLAQTLEQTIGVARQRQSALTAAMPKRFGNGDPLASFADEPGGSGGGDGGMGTGGGGTGSGRGSGIGLGGSGSGGFGGGGNGGGGVGGGGAPGGTVGATGGNGRPGGSGPGGNSAGGTGYAAGSGGQTGTQNGIANGAQGQAYSSGTSTSSGGNRAAGSAGGGNGAGGGGGGGGGGSSGGVGGTSLSGSGTQISTPNFGSGSNGRKNAGGAGGGSGGNGAGGNGSSEGGAGSDGGDYEGTAGATTNMSGGKQKSNGSKKSVASGRARGQNWGLPGSRGRVTAITRPIHVAVLPDRVSIVPERGDNRAVQELKISPNLTPQEVDAFVGAVQREMKSWGLAVENGYWKPQILMEVAPGAEQQHADLQTALEGSGFDLQRKLR